MKNSEVFYYLKRKTMPWTKTNYPDSMKKLPAAVRNKAIQIANAMLKEKKKMSEGMLIATSIRHAKDFVSKGEKNPNAVKKTKSVAKKTVNPSVKKTAKKVSARKTKVASKTKTVKAGASKAKAAKSKSKIAATKKAKSTSNKTKRIAAKETTKPVQRNSNNSVEEPVLRESLHHGEQVNFIPEHEGVPVTPMQSHQVERIMHQREEVALHQENQKVKDALATRKNFKRFNRETARR
jgi:uncharacterized protein YdaT